MTLQDESDDGNLWLEEEDWDEAKSSEDSLLCFDFDLAITIWKHLTAALQSDEVDQEKRFKHG